MSREPSVAAICQLRLSILASWSASSGFGWWPLAPQSPPPRDSQALLLELPGQSATKREASIHSYREMTDIWNQRFNTDFGASLFLHKLGAAFILRNYFFNRYIDQLITVMSSMIFKTQDQDLKCMNLWILLPFVDSTNPHHQRSAMKTFFLELLFNFCSCGIGKQ